MESLANEYYKPILKWVGMKRQMLSIQSENIPTGKIEDVNLVIRDNTRAGYE